MFEISYLGANSVMITTKKDTLYIDPNQSVNGLKIPNIKDAVQLATEKRFLVDQKSERPTLEGPGEYEIGPFAITGFETAHHIDNDGTMKASCYRVMIDDIAIGVIGNIQSDLSEGQLETLGLVDVLVVPVGGGGYTLDHKEAADLVRKVEPQAVIPVHYQDSGIKYEVPQDSLQDFVTELGAPVEKMAKFKVKSANDLPATMTIVELERA